MVSAGNSAIAHKVTQWVQGNIGKANSNKVSDKLTDVKHGLDELWALE